MSDLVEFFELEELFVTDFGLVTGLVLLGVFVILFSKFMELAFLTRFVRIKPDFNI